MGRCGSWRNPTEGTPWNAYRVELRLAVILFLLACVVWVLSSSSPYILASPSVRSFGCFETPCIRFWVWIIEVIGAEYGHLCTMGSRRTWENPTDPDGNPMGAQRRSMRRELHLFLGFPKFGPPRFPCFPFATNPTFLRLRKAWGWLAGGI